MKLKVINQDFSVCKLKDLSEVDYSDEFCFVGKTDEELSLVCSKKLVPCNAIECDNGWKAFRIQGVLYLSTQGFHIVGIDISSNSLNWANKLLEYYDNKPGF